jgi:hypothetical protein
LADASVLFEQFEGRSEVIVELASRVVVTETFGRSLRWTLTRMKQNSKQGTTKFPVTFLFYSPLMR